MKQLPEKIALDKAVNGQRHYQGTLEIKEMKRLTDLLADDSGRVEYSIQFERATRVLGKARVKVKTELSLMCIISLKKFKFPVDIVSNIGFIDDLAYEDLLDVDMEASWVEKGMISPLEIIEDELILAVPDAPFNENHEDDDINEAKVTDEKPNPFAVLKNLK